MSSFLATLKHFSGVCVAVNLLNHKWINQPITAKCQIEVSKWDYNWDKCDELRTQSRGYNYLFLIRSGQRRICKCPDNDRPLTDLGKIQLNKLSRHLNSLYGGTFANYEIKYATGKAETDTVEYFKVFRPDRLAIPRLEEMVPVKPDPDTFPWPNEVSNQEEADAFIKYLSESITRQCPDSFTNRNSHLYKDAKMIFLVLPSNLIRYIVCKLMQWPTSAWSRFNLPHASFTKLKISQTGSVSLFGIGDVGHLDREEISFE